jgi:tripartite-type tricarboxylate transporter receptor subunit TctC
MQPQEAPAATPKDIARRLSDENARIVRLDDMRTRLEGMSTIPAGGPPKAFQAFLREDKSCST